MLSFENNQLQGGNNNSALHLATSYHPIIDYLPITAHSVMVYSSFNALKKDK